MSRDSPSSRKGKKVVGGQDLPSFWERFDQLQRTANSLPGGVGPKGVFRFKTFAEFNAWKERFKSKQLSSMERKSDPRPK